MIKIIMLLENYFCHSLVISGISLQHKFINLNNFRDLYILYQTSRIKIRSEKLLEST